MSARFLACIALALALMALAISTITSDPPRAVDSEVAAEGVEAAGVE
jgi:hypothetical protein